MVGFNRRFASSYLRIKAAFADRSGPLVMSYRVNAGLVSARSWVLDPVQGGGRLLGEVCHMLDLLCDLAGAPIISVYVQGVVNYASASADDALLSLTFADGSIGTIVYATGGDSHVPKELLEVFGDGRAAILDDFRSVRLYGTGRAGRIGDRLLGSRDKGHSAELRAFVDAVRFGKTSPIDPLQAAHV